MIALIPARAGSKRLPGKNTKLLGGKPLIEWTIEAAQRSGVFERVCVATDIEAINIGWDGKTFIYRRRDVSDHQSDIEWVGEALGATVRHAEFCILRPTSPFRTADTIRRAYKQWHESKDCLDSLRAVRRVTETPYKMWRSTAPSEAFRDGYPMVPLLDLRHPDGTPYHSSPTQTLPTVYVQTGALEMGWTRNVEQLGSISGRKVGGFICEGAESVDLNTETDWRHAERLLASDPTLMASVGLAGVSATAPAQ